MNTEPEKAYVYQPLPPSEDGRFYGVAGIPDYTLKGISRVDAQRITRVFNETPERSREFLETVRRLIENEWKPTCGCRFESLFSNAVLLCEGCSKLPGHNRGDISDEVTTDE